MKVLFLESHALWIHGLPNGFADAGHTSIVSGRLTEENITHMIETFSPDLIVSLGWSPEHTRAKQNWIREAVRAKQIPLVYWATEDPLHTEKFTIPLLKRMQPDFAFTVTPSLCAQYEKLGVKAAPLEFGFHSSVHRQIEPLDEYGCDIAVVANAYPDYLLKEPDAFRMTSLETLVFPLLQQGFRIDFWGNDWGSMKYFAKKDIPKHWIHGYLDYSVANKVYSSAKIVIGPQNCTDQLTMRTYEILGSGGFLLTSDTPAVREKFQPKRDLIVSSSPRETVAKVKYYLTHPLEREQIRKNAQKIIAADSYRHRAEKMIEVLTERGVIRKSYTSGPGKVISYPRYIRQNYVLHTTKIGDTLVKIAETYGVSPEKIMKLNKLESDFIYAGETLKVKKK